MSTKASIDFNGDTKLPLFHLYKECLDEKGMIYLQIRSGKKYPLEFEATQDSVTVCLSPELWNRLIKAGIQKTAKELKAEERKWRKSKAYKEWCSAFA